MGAAKTTAQSHTLCAPPLQIGKYEPYFFAPEKRENAIQLPRPFCDAKRRACDMPCVTPALRKVAHERIQPNFQDGSHNGVPPYIGVKRTRLRWRATGHNARICAANIRLGAHFVKQERRHAVQRMPQNRSRAPSQTPGKEFDLDPVYSASISQEFRTTLGACLANLAAVDGGRSAWYTGQ